MAEQATINIKIDKVVKESAEAVLSGMGLSTASAIGLFLRQTAQDRKIPFEITSGTDFWHKEKMRMLMARILDTELAPNIIYLEPFLETKINTLLEEMSARNLDKKSSDALEVYSEMVKNSANSRGSFYGELLLVYKYGELEKKEDKVSVALRDLVEKMVRGQIADIELPTLNEPVNRESIPTVLSYFISIILLIDEAEKGNLGIDIYGFNQFLPKEREEEKNV